MKVYISPYPKNYSIYDLTEKFKFLQKLQEQGFLKPLEYLLEYISDKQGINRTIKIKLHPHDTYDMDGTLSAIILPLLKQLQENKHGAPEVNDEDVPDNLKGDDFYFERFDYVMNEMIWTFEQLQPEYDYKEQYESGVIDIQFSPIDITENTSKYDLLHTLVHGPNHTYKLDKEALEQHDNRIANGLRLFGKYYRHFWD